MSTTRNPSMPAAQMRDRAADTRPDAGRGCTSSVAGRLVAATDAAHAWQALTPIERTFLHGFTPELAEKLDALAKADRS